MWSRHINHCISRRRRKRLPPRRKRRRKASARIRWRISRSSSTGLSLPRNKRKRPPRKRLTRNSPAPRSRKSTMIISSSEKTTIPKTRTDPYSHSPRGETPRGFCCFGKKSAGCGFVNDVLHDSGIGRSRRRRTYS